MATKPKEHHPWMPVDYKAIHASAVQAMMHGEADEDQQKFLMKWLINDVCATYDQSYHPGVDGDRDTAFAEGKRFVGNTVIKMTRVNVSRMRQEEEDK